ncbi:MAG: protease modulator HflC [Vitreimonas sp.]
MNRPWLPFALVAGIALLVLFNTIYIVNPGEQAIVLRVGQWVRTVTAPGLYFKTPFTESTVIYSKRNLGLQLDNIAEIVAGDQERLEVDAFVRWRIIDPRRFYQTAGNQRGGETRLRAFTEDALRNTLGDATTNQIIAERRAALMQAIRTDLNRTTTSELGVRIEDVRIRKADLPQATRDSVYQRMRTEREQEAGRYRAQGDGEAQRIRAEADRQVVTIRATAQQQSETIQGEGDAERARIFAHAYGRDPEFAAFYRSMRAYEAALANGTPIIVPPDSDFFRYMRNRNGSGR